jgi:hypothetical protein
MFWLICTLLSNVIEQQDVYTAEQVAQLNAMKNQQVVETKDPTGGVVVYGINPTTVIDALLKSLTMEYSFLYDIDYTKTEAQCDLISNAVWETDTTPDSCKIPNVWFLPFSILLWGPIIAVGIYIILTIISVFRGGGT